MRDCPLNKYIIELIYRQSIRYSYTQIMKVDKSPDHQHVVCRRLFFHMRLVARSHAFDHCVFLLELGSTTLNTGSSITESRLYPVF